MPSVMFGMKPRAIFQAIYSDNANKVRVTGGCLCFCDDLSDPYLISDGTVTAASIDAPVARF